MLNATAGTTIGEVLVPRTPISSAMRGRCLVHEMFDRCLYDMSSTRFNHRVQHAV
jgi:hypothetical protein